MTETIPRFRYLDWFKKRLPKARIMLANSGIPHIDPAEFGIDLAALTLEIEDLHGYAPLKASVAAACGCRPEEVLPTPSCTYANYVALRGLLRPGDHALVERPTYELLVHQAALAGAEVSRFQRRRDDGYRIDPGALAAGLRDETRLVAVSSPHNPSGRRLTAGERDELCDLAATHGFTLLIDEVYHDADPQPELRTNFRADADMVVTSGLTKVYGLGNLRAGWVLAAPERVAALHRLNEFIADRPSAYAAQIGAAVLREPARSRIREITARYRAVNAPILDAFAAEHPELGVLDSGRGLNVLLVLPHSAPPAQPICERLLDEDGIMMVPGEMFEEPGVVRMSLSCEAEELRHALHALAAAISPGGRAS